MRQAKRARNNSEKGRKHKENIKKKGRKRKTNVGDFV
jgi:hypothetical protein